MKINKMVLAMLMSCAAATSFAGGEGSEFDWPPPTGVVRGLGNIVFGAGEVFRDMSYYGGVGYESASVPGAVGGGILGVVPGAVMCVVRVADGILDCFTLGIWGSSVSHTEKTRDFFPMFVWEDLWLPEALAR